MKIYKITEASEYLGVSINTLKTLANNKKINSFKTSGGHRRFRQDDLDAYMGVEKEKQENREKANKELESRLIFDSWTCRFCGGTFADRTLAIKHAIDCDDNEDVHSCATCASYEIGEDTRDGYRHICKGNPKRIDTWMKHCPEWIGA